MRGGEPSVIEIPIAADKMGNIVDTVPAVTLTFSDKPNLFISIDLKKYRGDVRTLLHHLFTIDGFDRNTTHNRETFLLGLADHQARVNNVITVNDYAQKYKKCNKSTIDRITRENQKFQDTDKKCDLDIELTEKNGDIIFEVKKYHRINFGTIDCMIANFVKECKFDPEDHSIIPGSCESVEYNPKKSGESYYPILEFADANPFFRGIDYIDYQPSTAWDKTFKKRQTNIFKFTVKSKTIAQLKDKLPKSIVLDDNGQPSTVDIEEKKLKDAETAKQKKIDDELAEKAREKDEATTNFDRTFVNIVGFKKVIENVKDITDFVIKWKNDNIREGYDSTNAEQVAQKRNELNEAFLSAYNEEKRKEIVDSLKLLLQYRDIYDDRSSATIRIQVVIKQYYKEVLEGKYWESISKYFLTKESTKEGTELVYLWEIFLPTTRGYQPD